MPASRPWGAALGRLDLLPTAFHVGGGQRARFRVVAEHVRMAADELGRRRFKRVGEREAPVLGAELGQEYRFEDQVAELVAQRRKIRSVDGVDHFVRFLDDERAE